MSDDPAPGTIGGVGFGLETYRPIEAVVTTLGERGVRTPGEIIRYMGGNVVSVEDLDGFPTYVNELGAGAIRPLSAPRPAQGRHSGVG